LTPAIAKPDAAKKSDAMGAETDQPTDLAPLNDLLGSSKWLQERVIFAHTESKSAALGSVDHPFGVGNRRRDWFFDKHVSTGLERFQRNRRVHRVRNAKVDRLNSPVAEQVVDIVIERCPEWRGDRRRSIVSTITYCYNFDRIRQRRVAVACMPLGDGATADDTNP
jgi:hypothetical protein